MSEGFGEFDVVAKDPAEEKPGDAARGVMAMPNPDLDDCPVVPLGFTGGKIVFAMPEGEIRQEPAAKIGSMLRTDIFACSAGWSFLTNWRSGEDDKFQQQQAATWFVRKCREAGLWDASRPVRSLGVWPGEGGKIVLHVGDELWRIAEKGKPEKLSIIQALRERKGPLYRLRPPAPRPDKSAKAADGQWVRQQLDLWRFEAIGGDGLTGADVVAGWTMAALLGAVAPFRGHVMANAQAGSGKSTLVKFVHALQSAVAGEVVDAFTVAGLRNELAGMARPVLLDEAESAVGSHGPGPVEQALELIRRMSTGSGGTRKQGDIGGGAVTQTAVGAVLMAAINPPKLGPADATRIVEVRLLPLSGSDLGPDQARPKAATRAELQSAIDKAAALGPALLGRALGGAWRYRADVDELGAAFARAGEAPRTGDLVAMLAAGRRLLLFDKPLTPEEADDEVRFWTPLLAQREAAEMVSNPGSDALAHLMASDSGIHSGGVRKTVGELVSRWLKTSDDYDDILAAHGLKVSKDPAPDGRTGPWLMVANHHPKLEAVFRGTPWPDHRRTLGFLGDLGPDCKPWATPNSIRFGVGVKQRALAIPLTPWIEDTNRVGAGVPPGVEPLRRSSPVPPSVPEEDVDWPD